MNEWPDRKLGELLTPVRRPVTVDLAHTYAEIGIRSFGRGVFHKPAVSGADLAAKKVFWLRPGELVINIVFAWEGAVAVTSPAEDGMIASHRFVTFQHDPEQADLAYLLRCLQSEMGVRLMRAASPGSAGRNRTLSVPTLMAQTVPLPPLAVQRRIATQLETQESLVGAANACAARLRQSLQALLESMCASGAVERPIGEVATRVSRPVDVQLSQQYDLLGVRWYGEGAFVRESPRGRDIAAKRLQEVRPGDFLYNRLFGWKGAFALSETSGYVSNEFPIYAGRDGICLTPYLAAVCRLPRFARQAEELSRGATTASRNRLREDAFESIRIPIPSLGDQERLCRATELVAQMSKMDARRSLLLGAILPAGLNAAFQLQG